AGSCCVTAWMERVSVGCTIVARGASRRGGPALNRSTGTRIPRGNKTLEVHAQIPARLVNLCLNLCESLVGLVQVARFDVPIKLHTDRTGDRLLEPLDNRFRQPV